MRKGIIVELSTADRARLEAVVADRNSPQKHVWRARIVLLTADGHGTALIMRQAGVSKVAVWRWQERFMVAGVEGLLRDKTRPSRIPALGVEVTARVVTLTTTGDPPGETTHWTATAMAQLVGISASSVQRIWRAHGLQPHRVRAFKLSNDPRFAEKLRAIVGLYIDPPAHAIVLSVDEKSHVWMAPARKGLVERFLRQAACNHVSGLIRGRHGPQALMGSADWDLNKSSGLRPSTFPGFPRSVGATDHAIALLSSQASAWRLRPTPQPRPGRLSAAP
jgi:transposase